MSPSKSPKPVAPPKWEAYKVQGSPLGISYAIRGPGNHPIFGGEGGGFRAGAYVDGLLAADKMAEAKNKELVTAARWAVVMLDVLRDVVPNRDTMGSYDEGRKALRRALGPAEGGAR